MMKNEGKNPFKNYKAKLMNTKNIVIYMFTQTLFSLSTTGLFFTYETSDPSIENQYKVYHFEPEHMQTLVFSQQKI